MALRLLKGVRELRFILCQSSNQSEALRYINNEEGNTSLPTMTQFDRVLHASSFESVKTQPQLLSQPSTTEWSKLSISAKWDQSKLTLR